MSWFNRTIEARYYNCNGYAVAIVAVVTEEVDWAAYIGGSDGKLSEKETIEWVVRKGAKLTWKDASHYFPEIKLPYCA